MITTNDRRGQLASPRYARSMSQRSSRQFQDEIVPSIRMLAALAAMLAVVACGNADPEKKSGPTLSDRQAKALVENDLPNTFDLVFPTGQVFITRLKTDLTQGEVADSDSELLLRAKKVGLVEIVEDRNFHWLRDGGSALGNQKLHKLSVTPTELAKKSGCLADPPQSNVLRCRGAKGTEVEIFMYEEKKVGANDFRLILYKYRASWAPFLIGIAGEESSNMNAAALYRWDAFEKKWNRQSVAVGDGTKPLDTAEIDKVLLGG